MDTTHTLVELWIGELHAPRCVADVFDNDVLTISAIDDGHVLRTIPPGDWKTATVFSANGYPLYAHHAKTPTRQPVKL